jgi:hypothetical protein
MMMSESFQLSTQDHDTISELTQQAVKTTQTLTTNKTYDLCESYDLIFDFYSLTPKPFDTKTHRFLAQLSRVYDLTMRILCTQCDKLYNMCVCKAKGVQVEISCKLLIDDHTGLLKVAYKNNKYDLNDKQSIFYKISGPLLKLLKHCGRVSIPLVPKTQYSCETNCGMGNTQTYETRICQILYDYIANCVLNSYHVFEVRPSHSKNFFKSNGLMLVNASNVNNYLALSKTVYEAECLGMTNALAFL